MSVIHEYQSSSSDVLVFFYQIQIDDNPKNCQNNSTKKLDAIFKISEQQALSLRDWLAGDERSKLQDASILDQTILSGGGLLTHIPDLDTQTNLSRSQASFSDDESASMPLQANGSHAPAALLERQLLKQTALLHSCNARRQEAVARAARLEAELSDARALVDWHLCRAAQCVIP
jgi:hypothetical protein